VAEQPVVAASSDPIAASSRDLPVNSPQGMKRSIDEVGDMVGRNDTGAVRAMTPASVITVDVLVTETVAIITVVVVVPALVLLAVIGLEITTTTVVVEPSGLLLRPNHQTRAVAPKNITVRVVLGYGNDKDDEDDFQTAVTAPAT
jgi:hypothetical protein